MVIIEALDQKCNNDEMAIHINKNNHELSIVDMKESHFFIKHFNCKIFMGKNSTSKNHRLEKTCSKFDHHNQVI